MNIAIFPSAFHPSLGGVEELTRQLALELRRQGHEILIVTERWPRDLPAAERLDGLDIRRFPMRVPTGHWKANLSYALTHRPIRSAIVRMLREFRPDVLHVQCVSSTTLYALHAHRVLKRPLVVTLQGELTMDAGGIFQQPGISQEIFRHAFDQAEIVTGCSRDTLEEAERMAGRPLVGRGRVIPNGVRAADFESASPLRRGRPFALAIGRHVPQKGFDVLLKAWALLRGEVGLDLVLAGDGPERAALTRLRDSLGLSGSVDLIGRADRQTTTSLFAGCRFFVLPSRHEPFGIVNLEAMVAGKAVIATAVGGVPEVVQNNTTGLLVPGEDPESLASAIRRLAREASLADSLGARGRQAASRFEWQHVAGEYLQCYRDAFALN